VISATIRFALHWEMNGRQCSRFWKDCTSGWSCLLGCPMHQALSWG